MPIATIGAGFGSIPHSTPDSRLPTHNLYTFGRDHEQQAAIPRRRRVPPARRGIKVIAGVQFIITQLYVALDDVDLFATGMVVEGELAPAWNLKSTDEAPVELSDRSTFIETPAPIGRHPPSAARLSTLLLSTLQLIACSLSTKSAPYQEELPQRQRHEFEFRGFVLVLISRSGSRVSAFRLEPSSALH
jgi:hypothetical protein